MSHNHNIFPTWAFREKFGNEREDGEQSLSEEQGGKKSPLSKHGRERKKHSLVFIAVFFFMRRKKGAAVFLYLQRDRSRIIPRFSLIQQTVLRESASFSSVTGHEHVHARGQMQAARAVELTWLR